MREGIDDKAFPEQGAKVSIHSDGSFEGLGCVLANTNLNVLTAVFYWFTLKRDEPFIRHSPPHTSQCGSFGSFISRNCMLIASNINSLPRSG